MERPRVAWSFSLGSQGLFDVPEIGQPHVLKVLLMKLLSEHREAQGSDRNKRDNLTPCFVPKGLIAAVTL